MQTVAEAMNYSDAYFCKIFKQCFDKESLLYLSEYRVARVKELLGDVLINVKDVSQKVGYRLNYFAKYSNGLPASRRRNTGRRY